MQAVSLPAELQGKLRWQIYRQIASLGAWALGHAGFSSCSSQALEHSLNSCGAQA